MRNGNIEIHHEDATARRKSGRNQRSTNQAPAPQWLPCLSLL